MSAFFATASQPGVVTAPQSGVVTPSQPGVVTASQPGVVTASQPGVVTASQPGVVTASQPGVVTPPVLETDRLRLRAFAMRDFEPLVAFFAIKELNLYRGGTQTRAETWYYMTSRLGEWQIRGYGCFAIEDKASGESAGYCGLRHPIELDEPELTWSLFADYHGRGLATEAARGVMGWAYETLKLPPLMSYVHPDNTASISVAKRLGAKIDGELIHERQKFVRYRHVASVAALPDPEAC